MDAEFGWGGRDSRSRRARHTVVPLGRVQARLPREAADQRGVGFREPLESCCTGRAFARRDLVDRLWARADPHRAAPACRAGRVRPVAAHHGRHPVDPGAGGRVVSAGRDDLHPGRRLLHRRAGELRAAGGAGGRGGIVDRLRRDGRGAVGGRHGGGGLRRARAGPLQPGDHRRGGDPDLLREPARVARSGSAVRGRHLRVRGDGRGDDCHRRRTPHRLGLTAIRSRPRRRSGSGSSGQRSGDGRDDPGVAAGVRQRRFVADRRRGHLQHRPGLPQTAEHQRAAGADGDGRAFWVSCWRASAISPTPPTPRRFSPNTRRCSRRSLARFSATGCIGNTMYVLVQISTAAILYTGANTSFNGFPGAGEFRCGGPLSAAPAHATRLPAGVLQRHHHARGVVGGVADLHRRVGQRAGAVLRDRRVHRLLDGRLRNEQAPPDRTRTGLAAQVGDQLLRGG